MTGPEIVAAWRAEWEKMGWALLQGLPAHVEADLVTRIDNAILDAATAPTKPRARG